LGFFFLPSLHILLFGLENAHSFVPAHNVLTSAGAQDPSMTGAVAPARQGLVIDRSSTALCLETRGALGLDVARYSDLGVAFGRSCREVHGACDVRINLYPAAPIRLAKVLHAWTIAQEGWGSSFERQIGKRRSAMRTHSHTSDLPDTPDWGVGTQRTVEVIA
jgi:hypothetical protein